MPFKGHAGSASPLGPTTQSRACASLKRHRGFASPLCPATAERQQCACLAVASCQARLSQAMPPCRAADGGSHLHPQLPRGPGHLCGSAGRHLGAPPAPSLSTPSVLHNVLRRRPACTSFTTSCWVPCCMPHWQIRQLLLLLQQQQTRAGCPPCTMILAINSTRRCCAPAAADWGRHRGCDCSPQHPRGNLCGEPGACVSAYACVRAGGWLDGGGGALNGSACISMSEGGSGLPCCLGI